MSNVRILQEVYSVVFLDAIHYKVKEEGRVITKAAYTCLGIDLEGRKEILGIWVGESEGAKFWLRVCSELSHRGVKDILIACIDGLERASQMQLERSFQKQKSSYVSFI